MLASARPARYAPLHRPDRRAAHYMLAQYLEDKSTLDTGFHPFRFHPQIQRLAPNASSSSRTSSPYVASHPPA